MSGLAWADTATGKKLNAEGYELYKKQDFAGALKLFAAAVEAAPRLAIARYNLAATMSRTANGCTTRGSEIVRELKASIELDAGRLERARVDTDFDYVRATVGFQRLVGADLRSVAGLTRLLPSVRWRPPTDCGSDMGCGYGLRFLPDGKLERADRDANGLSQRRIGTWRVEESSADAGAPVLRIVIDVPAKGSLGRLRDVGQLVEDGRLLFDSVWWTDDPEGCCC